MAKGKKRRPRPAPAGRKAPGGRPGGARPKAPVEPVVEPAVKPRRAERIEAERRARRRRSRRIRLAVAAVVLGLVAVALGVMVAGRRGEQAVVERITAGSCDYDERHDRDQGPGRNHAPSGATLRYSVDPPAGGDHLPNAASAGVYTAQTVPPDGALVHGMEHGFVVLWHRPDLSEADMEVIDGLAEEFERELIVAPRASLDRPVAVTAWHRRLLCGTVERAAVAGFVRAFRDKGPEKGHL